VISLLKVPHGLAEIVATYGDPDTNDDAQPDAQFERDQLIVVELPFPMVIPWRPADQVRRVKVHRLIAASLVDALQEVLEKVGLEELQAMKWDRWGGCYCFRQMRGYPALSVHSWGCAVDICPDLGRFGHREDIATFPHSYVFAFASRGWDWGGSWPAKWGADAMHFQACTGY
jgi:hypothetical protein